LATTQASRRSARRPEAGSEHPSSGGLGHGEPAAGR
jgi:hypothetical protein